MQDVISKDRLVGSFRHQEDSPPTISPPQITSPPTTSPPGEVISPPPTRHYAKSPRHFLANSVENIERLVGCGEWAVAR